MNQKKKAGVALTVLVYSLVASATFSWAYDVKVASRERVNDTAAVVEVVGSEEIYGPEKMMMMPVVTTIQAELTTTTTTVPKIVTEEVTTTTSNVEVTFEVTVPCICEDQVVGFQEVEPVYQVTEPPACNEPEPVYDVQEVYDEVPQSVESVQSEEFDWFFVPENIDIDSIEVNSDAYLLAYAMSKEAAFGNYMDARLVGEVILNRVDSPEFENSVMTVIEQRGQYSGWPDPYNHYYPRENILDENYLRIALDLVQGNRNTPDDIVWQAQFQQGAIWKTVGSHYYCHRYY